MRGEAHLLVSILIAAPTSMVLFNLLPSDSANAIAYLLGGVMIGAILPDVDASDVKLAWRR